MLYPKTKQTSETKPISEKNKKKNKEQLQKEKQNKANTDKDQGKADRFH